MDYLNTWLARRFASDHTCYNWFSLTYHAILVLIAALGLVGAARRRDRALACLLTGILLLFAGNLVSSLGTMLFVPDPTQHPFMVYVEALRPWYLFSQVNDNLFEPLGLILGVVGAIGLARSGEARAAGTGLERKG